MERRWKKKKKSQSKDGKRGSLKRNVKGRGKRDDDKGGSIRKREKT